MYNKFIKKYYLKKAHKLTIKEGPGMRMSRNQNIKAII